MGYFGWKPYIPVAERRKKAEKAAAKMQKNGVTLTPVIGGRGSIAKTFWGKAWCDNLERYSDYANRLPRGRTYVRNGSVIDLNIAKGTVQAQVMGSRLYKVEVSVAAVPARQWQAISADCAGSIASLVELIQNLDRDLPAMRMSRQQQIITLPGRHGKHVGIVLEENIGCARDDEALGAAQILAALALGLEVETHQIEHGVAEAQGLRLAAQEADAETGGLARGIVFRADIALVIAHAAEDAGIGFEARQLADAGIERIAVAADQVDSCIRQLRVEVERGIDHPGELD